MANQEQLKILKQGVKVWNKWRAENFSVVVDLSESDLVGANLIGANLIGVNLSAADLRGINLRSVELSGANLIGANLRRADLRGSNFLKVEVGGTIFGDSDLSKAIGLGDVVHHFASTIGTDPIAESKGDIPEIFLRGCGLSDWEIESAKLYNPELSNEEINKILYRMYDLRASQALQISPLFISYSQGDGAFVDKLEVHLNEKGVRFWRDVHKATSGRLENKLTELCA